MVKESAKKLIRSVLRAYVLGTAVLIVLLWLVSWLMGIYIDGVESVLTSNGIRWLVGNLMENFKSMPLAEIICGLMGVSVLRESGIVKLFDGHISLKQKRAIQITAVFIAVFALLFSLLLLLPDAILLSAFGGLDNSPLMKGLYGIVMLFVLLIGNIYGYTSGRFVNLHDFVQAHVSIFHTVSSYFIILFLGCQFVSCLDFSNIFVIVGNEDLIISISQIVLYYIPLILYVLLVL